MHLVLLVKEEKRQNCEITELPVPSTEPVKCLLKRIPTAQISLPEAFALLRGFVEESNA